MTDAATDFNHRSSGSDQSSIEPQKQLTSTAQPSVGHCLDKSMAGRQTSLWVKRAIDIVGALVAIILLAPVLLIICVAIKLTSAGPVVFAQKRWGKNCDVITIYKFRSMRIDLCDVAGVNQTVENDQRITAIGHFLRKSNLDELPQLYNVLKGDMSLVGPRCHAIGTVAAGVPYEDLIETYHKRHDMRPGITGLAQVRGLRGPTVRACKARARIYSDHYYVDNYSLWLDMKIIYLTIKNELFNGSGF